MSVLLLLVFGVIWLIVYSSKRKQRKHSEAEQYETRLRYLQEQIRIAEEQLEYTQPTPTNLTVAHEKALDEYDSHGIRIPSDIIEQLSIMRHYTVEQSINFIETQRQHIKLECTKKLPKGGV